MKKLPYQVIIVGGGACGLMCAVQCGFFGLKSLVLEHNPSPGAKILISGGGRCNYTNIHCSAEQFISQNQHFAISPLAQYSAADIIAFFESCGIYGAEKTLGQIFPENARAKDVLAALLNQCSTMQQDIKCSTKVTDVTTAACGYTVHCEHAGKTFTLQAPHVVIATGGLPVAPIGATDFALKLAGRLAIPVTPVSPGLVPLTITGKDLAWFAALSGNSIYATVSNSRASFTENVLFTHWGLSGPAILQISSYWQPGEDININLLPGYDIINELKDGRAAQPKTLLSSFLHKFYSKKFILALGDRLPINKTLGSLSGAEISLIADTIHNFTVKPAGTKGYAKAEVMLGGINTNALSSKTLESIKYPGLYFGGECIDVTGWLGGYNFQWAWASAYVIAQGIAARVYK